MPKKMNPIDAHIRARNVARKLIETQGTMRSVAKELGVSVMTVHRDIHLLEEKDPSLFGVVKEQLDRNFAEKLSRGAETMKRKAEERKSEHRQIIVEDIKETKKPAIPLGKTV